ncbi:MATE family efflux transporter [Anaerosporobacter faecicola]|uniref:MATE family efflux transporter n=1 Tax=Anaerosporobacter faecicola TaxID=2718714 RepID=UPI00143C5BF1|nr:MATE family efflux transporter [Anaerosporobacter faecicola]
MKQLHNEHRATSTCSPATLRHYIMRIIMLAIPIALQNLINVGVSVTDTLMIGSISEEQLSGISYANQPYFVFTTVLFGLASGSIVLTAQYWGKQDLKPIRAILGLMLRIGILAGLLVSLFVLLKPETAMSIFTNEPEIIKYGAKYLRIVGFSYMFSAFTGIYLMSMRSTGNVYISACIYGISFILNVFLNWVLIFGHLGMPRLEIQGAATATLISRILESVLTVCYMYLREGKLRFTLKDLFHHTKKYWSTLVRYSIPVLLSEVCWGIGISVQAAIIGRLGKSAITASSYINQVQQLAGIILIGFGVGTGIVMGNIIGEGKEKEALEISRVLIKVSAVLGFIVAVAVIAFRPIAPNFINCTPETASMIQNMLFGAAYLLFFQAFSILTMAGILRGSGDTIYCTTLDVLTLFVIKLGVGIFVAGVLKLNPVFVYIILCSDEMMKTLLTIPRILKGNWIHHTTLNE